MHLLGVVLTSLTLAATTASQSPVLECASPFQCGRVENLSDDYMMVAMYVSEPKIMCEVWNEFGADWYQPVEQPCRQRTVSSGESIGGFYHDFINVNAFTFETDRYYVDWEYKNETTEVERLQYTKLNGNQIARCTLDAEGVNRCKITSEKIA